MVRKKFYSVPLIRRMIAFLLVLIMVITCINGVTIEAANNGFYVSGTTIYDANGNPFEMRGVNIAHAWYAENTEESIKGAADLGANTVRIVLSDGQQWTKTTATEVSNIIEWCKENKVVCVLEVHDTTGSDSTSALDNAVNYWIEMKDLLNANTEYVIVNIANEWYGTWNGSAWAEGNKSAIQTLRNAGINNMLMVDCAGWGQYPDSIKDYGKQVFDADSQKNTVFSIHMYEYAGKDATTVKTNIDNALGIGVPLVIGEFASQHTDGDVDEYTIMNYCEEKGVGYLGWSWKGNNSELSYLDIASTWDGSSLSTWGDTLFNNTYGIKNTSATCSVYGGQSSTENVLPLYEVDKNQQAPMNNLQILNNMEGAKVEVVEYSGVAVDAVTGDAYIRYPGADSETDTYEASVDASLAQGNFWDSDKEDGYGLHNSMNKSMRGDAGDKKYGGISILFEGSDATGDGSTEYADDYAANYRTGWDTEDLDIDTTTMKVKLKYTNVGYYKGKMINAYATISIVPSKNRNPDAIWNNNAATDYNYRGVYQPMLQVSHSLYRGWVWQNVETFKVDLQFYYSDEENNAQKTMIEFGNAFDFQTVDQAKATNIYANSLTADYYVINSLNPTRDTSGDGELYAHYIGPEYVLPNMDKGYIAYNVGTYTLNGTTYASNIKTVYKHAGITQYAYNGGVTTWSSENDQLGADGWAQNSVLFMPEKSDTLSFTMGQLYRDAYNEIGQGGLKQHTDSMWATISTTPFTAERTPINIDVTKSWTANSDDNVKSVTLELWIKEGTALDQMVQAIELTAANSWTGSFSGIATLESGQTYYVKETKVTYENGSEANIDEFDASGTMEIATTTLSNPSNLTADGTYDITESFAVINDYTQKTGTLVITQSFTGKELTEDQKNKITYTVTGANGYSKTFRYEEMDKSSGTATYRIPDLAVGEYTITESNYEVEGYEETVTYTVGTVVTDDKAEADVVKNTETTVPIVNNYTQTVVAPTATPVPVATATPAPVATATPAPAATATPVPEATATPAPVATATPVPVATATPVPVATATPVPEATATPAPAATATPAPVATATPVPVATATPVPVATATPAPVATATPVPVATATPAPVATATPAPVATAMPVPEATATPVPAATATPVPEATATPAPVATATPAPVATATPVPAATATPVPVATATPVPVATATPAPVATATPAPVATATPAPEATATPVPVATATPVPEATATPAPVATATPAPVATATPVPVATATPVPAATATPAPAATATPVPEATATPVPAATETPVPEATATPAPAATATPVPEATATPAPEATATPVPEATATPAPEVTATPDPAATATPAPIPTNSPTATQKPVQPPAATAAPTAVPAPTATPVPSGYDSVPKTSDEAPIGIWMVGMLLSLSGMVGIKVYLTRSRRNRNK